MITKNSRDPEWTDPSLAQTTGFLFSVADVLSDFCIGKSVFWLKKGLKMLF